MRVLIVEDQTSLARDLAEQFARSGFSTDCAASLAEARQHSGEHAYGLALIDRRLPDGDGLALLPSLRNDQPDLCVMMLTALDDTCEIVSSLDAGADDYIKKPFEPDELMARIRAALRRVGKASAPMKLGALSFDPASSNLLVHGKLVMLQRLEASLLEALLRRAGRIVSRRTLLEEVWGENQEVTWHTASALVSQLRLRLKESDANVEIHAARGIGYLITEEKP